MKKTLFLFSLLFLAAFGFSQITLESGAQLIVSSGSTVIASDGIVSNGGSIDNAGTIEIKGDLENNTSALTTTGSTGTIKFNGSAAQEITGDADAAFYGTVEIDNSTGVSITNTATGAHQTINGTLAFTNGLLTLNAFNLTLGSTDATGVGAGKYVQTNSTGVMKRSVPGDGATDVVYPVGNSAYNPVTLQNSAAGDDDDYGVRVVDAEPAAGSTNHFVDRSWEITESTVGGTELTVTPQWNSGEELTDFDRTNASVGLTTDNGGTYEWGGTSAASGSDPYTVAGSTFTGVGTFTVGDYYNAGKRLALKLFLAGPFNGSTMDKDLNTAGKIPTVDPYGISPDAPSIPTNAVDWVKIQLRDNGDNSSVIKNYSCFVDVNGNLLERDGTSGLNMTGFDNSTPYYVAVLHRNHFGVVSSATVDMSAASPSYDYTTAQAQAWQDGTITTNAAMKEVTTGVFGLWEGDATGNGEIAYNGGGNDRLAILTEVGSSTPGNTVLNVYSNNDVNMDADVIYNGAGSDRVSILTIVGSSTPGVVFTSHLP